MVKKTRFTPGAFQRAALVVIGWVCFVLGALISEPAVKLPLLAIARVLPQALIAVPNTAIYATAYGRA